jgi:DNA-binding transcriptional regulator YdaS (Cro superfamily)
MNHSDFVDRASRALGGARGWKSRLSKALGVAPSTVQRWASGEIEVPDYVVAVIELLEKVPVAFRPARWI